MVEMSEIELLELGRDEQRSLYFNSDSYRCALLSAGGAIETCSAVMDGVVKNAIAVIRPPGHHAEPCQAMGFCLFNNVAIATKMMQQRYGEECQRVLIVDWYTHPWI
jgi:histone deacetylase 6